MDDDIDNSVKLEQQICYCGAIPDINKCASLVEDFYKKLQEAQKYWL